MRLAYADRDQYLGDPDFVRVPVAGLIDPAYLAEPLGADLARPDALRASQRRHAAPARPVNAAGLDTAKSAAPRISSRSTAGAMSLRETSTIESGFGSGLMVNGYYLNNELTDFSLVPDEERLPVANRVEGGKRPRSSMSPTIVYGPDGHVRLAVGAAGGATIIAQVAKAIIGVIDWKLSAQDALALADHLRARRTPSTSSAGTFLEAMTPALQALGHAQVDYRAPPGFKANAIEFVGGRWVGAADPRSEGAAVSRIEGSWLASSNISTNLVSMFLTRAAEKGDAPFLWAKRDGAWHSISWREAARQVAALAESLKRIGLQPGDRVMLVSENRPEWLIADLGIMAAGCVTVPTYTTNTTRDHAHILGNSGARAVIVSNQKLAKNLVPAVLFASECHHVIGIEDIRTGQAPDWVDCPPLGRPGRRRSRTSPRSSERMAGGRARRPRLHHLHQRHRRRAARRPAASRRRSSTISKAAPTSSRPTSAGTTRSSCPSCRRATPMSIPAASISRSRSARRSITPKASRSSPPISRKCGRRSWSWCRGCSRCCARGSSRRSRSSGGAVELSAAAAR